MPLASDSGPIPADARIMWSQLIDQGLSDSEGFYGSHFLNMGVRVPGDYIPTGAVYRGTGTVIGSTTNIAVFDPTSLGAASAYVFRQPLASFGSQDVTSNIYWLWDLQAIADEAGAEINPFGTATLTLMPSDSHAPTGPVSAARVMTNTMSGGTDMVEPAVAPRSDTSQSDPTVSGNHPRWVASDYAWAESATDTPPDPSNPEVWAISGGVADPVARWGSQWTDLMTPGGPSGSVMRLPKMPIRPIETFAGLDAIPAGTTGAWSTSFPLNYAAYGRWVSAWVMTEAEADWWSYNAFGGTDPPLEDRFTWWDFGLVAYLTVPFKGDLVPPLQQRAHLINNPSLLQRNREVRTLGLTARGRF